MTALAAPVALLEAWESAASAAPVARPAVLVQRAGLAATLDEALDLDVGRCAALALQVLRDTGGAGLEVVVTCEACGTVLETGLPDDAGDAVAGIEQAVGEWVVRAPSTRDLLAAGASADPVGTLLARCVRSAATGAAAQAHALPSQERAAVDAAAERLAGPGGWRSTVACPGCDEPVEAGLDVGAVLWEHVSGVAPALLDDVATLARAFGWSEPEVLALPPARRAAYLLRVPS